MEQSISKKSWCRFALLLLIIMSLKAHLSTASDTMYPGQPLAWNQTLISKNGIFELGFFTPEGYLFVIVPKGFKPRGIQQIGTHMIYTGRLIMSLGGDLYIRISASELMGSKNKILRKVAWIVGVLVTRSFLSIGFANYMEETFRCCFGSVFKGILPKFNNYSSEENEKSTARKLLKDFSSMSTCQKVRDFSRVLTTMRGTRGYLAPEWISGEAITPKVDVFSYGKLLFEIVSGRRNISMLDDEICNYFPARVAIAMSKGEDLLTLLDHKLEGSANMEELTRACTVACWCIQDDPRDRPTMGQVVKILEGVMHVGIPQIPLYFQRLSENPTEAIVFHETATSLSSY
uniref:Protein kinase domain-containing protein n=1 Tax=Fagus sylvatica TaxID=28930 RepID=A0A2N9EZJ0_FAGSY